MRIAIVTPAGRASKSGNRNTAVRWAGFLRELGHRVRVQVQWDGWPADLLLALHARKSHPSIREFARAHPDRPVILALTGTDLYRDIRFDADARASMTMARRMIVLQEQGLDELPAVLRRKTRVVRQSAKPAARRPPLKSCFEVCVIGHLRAEKDPFRCALALAHLPGASRIRITHLGRAMSGDMESLARSLMARDYRYRWRGEVPHWRARQVLARSRVLVVSSRMEGGANVVSEAIASGVPVIASRVPGNVGMLGRDYAGYYPVEDEKALARLLTRAERDRTFLGRLRVQCAARRPLFTARQEKAALAGLLREIR